MACALQCFEEGDILKFPGQPDHFAIYAGKDQIIHYQKRGGVKKRVIEESIQDYWKSENKSKQFSLFGSKYRTFSDRHSLGIVDQKIVQHTFSGPETVRRARSMLNGENYSIFAHNCEHFVNWCKYGLKASETVEKAAMVASVPITAGAGAAAGALGGAAIGSVVPVVGTAIGALIGGIGGAVVGTVYGSGGSWGANTVARGVKAEKGDD